MFRVLVFARPFCHFQARMHTHTHLFGGLFAQFGARASLGQSNRRLELPRGDGRRVCNGQIRNDCQERNFCLVEFNQTAKC